MALYHMVNLVGPGSRLSWFSICRCLRKEAKRQANEISKIWIPRRGRPLILSASLIVKENTQERERQISASEVNHAELSPIDNHDKSFSCVTSPKVAQGSRMKLFEELRDSFPSSSETLSKLEEAKEKLTTSLHDFTERLNNEPLSSILSEKAIKVSEQASIEADEIVEQVTETLEETREAIQNITQNITSRLVKPPEPGVVQPIARPEPNHHPVNISLTEDIMSQNRKRECDEDTVLVPRIKAAVRQFKAEIDADESGDPPISLVSRKAMARIEQFIRTKRAKVQEKLAEKIHDKISDKFDFVKDISIVGGRNKRDESIMEYITSNVPNCDTEDPELKDIMLDSAGTFYNDSFLVDSIEVEDEALLTTNGWTMELAQDNLRMWKKFIPEENVSLYKIFGYFDTISAVEFYNAQVNDQYRSVWDRSVSSLYVVDNITNNREIVYWATKFPFPLQDRDYVFERSHIMDTSSLKIVIANRSVTHKSKPESSKFVRVSKYGSKLVIFGNQDLYQKGMSYCLTYYDDFGMPIPNQVKDKFANSKIPDFLDKVHGAALYLGATGKLYIPYPDPPSAKKLR